MQQIIIENIEQSIIYVLERAQFEYEMRKEIVEKLLENDNINISSERFKIYLQELDEKKVFYETIKKAFTETVVKQYVPKGYEKDYNWTLSYFTRDLIINYDLKGINNI